MGAKVPKKNRFLARHPDHPDFLGDACTLRAFKCAIGNNSAPGRDTETPSLSGFCPSRIIESYGIPTRFLGFGAEPGGIGHDFQCLTVLESDFAGRDYSGRIGWDTGVFVLPHKGQHVVARSQKWSKLFELLANVPIASFTELLPI